MAFISTDQAKVVRNELKAQFPSKDGWKFSVTVHNYMNLQVAIMKAPIDFLSDADEYEKKNGYRSLNPFYLNQYENGDVLQTIKDIANKGNYDNSDIMTDYFDVGFYFDLQVGKWDKPFIKA